jgi:hypothetical protein
VILVVLDSELHPLARCVGTIFIEFFREALAFFKVAAVS